MSLILNGDTGVQFNDASLQGAAASPYVLKNRIINGDMRIDQRNAGASGTANNYTVDRWQYYGTQASKFTWQQNAGSVTLPAGFTNYLGFTSSSTYSVLSTDIFEIYQPIEGLNVADLDFGKATAKTITLSFWVRSSLTGTFGGGIGNATNTRNYPFTYTISLANTWEQKTITIAGDTTGTWGTGNGLGIAVVFGLGAGSSFLATANSWNGTTNATLPTGATSVVGTNGATFYITGVQLEVGSTATPFERRLYSQELINCERYFEIKDYPGSCGKVAICYNGSAPSNPVQYQEFAVTKRAAPVISWTSNGGGRYVSNVGIFGSQTFTAAIISVYGCQVSSSSTASASAGWLDNVGSMYINAEL